MDKRKIVLTRHENELEKLTLLYPGVEWIDFPLIQFDAQVITDSDLYRISEEVDWLVFTSQNGVRCFFDQVDNSFINNTKIACVGPKTAARVSAAGYKVAFTPSHYTSLTLAREIPLASSETVCYVGGNLSSAETLDVLRERARSLIQVESYHTVSTPHRRTEWIGMIAQKPDVISFCSPSAVSSFVNQLKSYGISASADLQYAAIGSTTAAAIKDLLGCDSIIGKEYTFNSMIEAMITNVLSD